MPEDTHLSALPEVVPLRSVAPLWRWLAILALVASGVLLLLVAILGVALLEDSSRPMPPAMAATPMVAGGSGLSQMPALPDNPDEGEPAEDGPPDDPRARPYPLRADLAEAERRAARPPRETASRRFVRLGQEVWRGRKGLEPEHLSVSADGRYLATVHGERLLAGTVVQGLTITVTGNDGEVFAARPPGFPGGREFDAPATPPPLAPGAPAGGGPAYYELARGEGPVPRPVIGVPSWARNAPAVYAATGGGLVRACRIEGGPAGPMDIDVLPLSGEAVAEVPGSAETFILVRARAVPKVEAPGEGAPADPTEVVLRDLGKKSERVLIPAGPAAWKYPAASADGRQLVLVSNHGHEKGEAELWRVFLLDLSGGAPRPLTPAAPAAGPVCWTPDGRALLYARSQHPAPVDHLEDEPAAHGADLDLFHLDLRTGKETRLTRGGGFFSPSVDADGNLYYLTSRGAGTRPILSLVRMTLESAQTFAAREREAPRRTAEEWGKLADLVLADAGLKADADGAAVTPEMLAKAADAFARRYEEVFERKAPASLEALDRQRRELESLKIAPELHQKLRLLVGAAEGEFLRRNHGARWRLVKGPRAARELDQPSAYSKSLFAVVHNPFDLAINLRETLSPESFHLRQFVVHESVLSSAAGRTLVLSNDPTGGAEWVKELVDPDLARGEELLKEGKAEEGERLLLALMQREAHRDNAHLALHVATLLYTHQRLAAVADLMKRHARKGPLAAAKYNLLGLAQLPANPQDAVGSFRTALRHDLHHGPAYLNLAQAYQKSNNLPAAAACLRRYLQLQPQGPYARDAQRRLGEVEVGLMDPVPPPPGGPGGGGDGPP